MLEKKYFEENLRLCALGARICYSLQNIDDTLNDDRVNGDGYLKYLENIFKMKHFSVFSHDFNYIDIENTKEYSKYFKTKIISEQIVGVSARHYLENQDFFPFENKNSHKIDILKREKNNNIDVALLHLNRDYDGWAVIYIDGISRAISHQLVRYTSLNFSQRSQRYCSEKDNNFYFPDLEYINEENKKIILDIFERNYAKNKLDYQILISLGVKKEDARYVLPNATKTTLLMSGTLKDINHMIIQRKDKHAQKEIRDLACLIEKLLI